MKSMKKPNFPEVMSLTLSQGHSLVVGHIPDKVSMSDLSRAIVENATAESIKSFGLFDSTAPNYTTFYPDATPDDWTPKEEDFVTPVFRLFSETIVVKYGIPIDFSTPGLLKNSMGMLVGATVNPDHEGGSVGNALGSIPSVEWQESYTVKGVQIPAGILGKLKIDAKSNPRIARGVMMDPPSIHSTSVTVRFKWEKSHPDMEDFWEKVGSYDKDQNLIRLIVTEITSYPEVSLVHHGADPYAQKTNSSGAIVNPIYAKSVYAFSADPTDGSELKCGINFKGLCSLAADNTFIHNPKSNKMELKQILAMLGLAEDAFATQEELLAHYESLTADRTSLEDISTELGIDEESSPVDAIKALKDNQIPEGAKLMTDKEAALIATLTEVFGEALDTTDWAELSALAGDGKTYLEDIRSKATSLYKLVSGEENVDPTIVEAIEKASLKEVKAYEVMYQKLADTTAPLTCQECGSKNVSRASAKIDPKPGEDGKGSYADTKKKVVDSHKRKASDIHGE